LTSTSVRYASALTPPALQGLDQRSQHRPACCAFIAAHEQSVLSAESNRTHRALDNLLNMAAIEKGHQPILDHMSA